MSTRQEHAARIRQIANTPEARRKRRATMRGVDVPPDREAEWQALRRKGLTSREAAEAMGLARLVCME